MAQTISPSMWARPSAIASSVETAAAGSPAANASPFAAATPMRIPVKDPGPTATATAPSSSMRKSAFFSMDSTMGISVRLWVSPVF